MDQVIKRGGWSFLLPDGHNLEVDKDRRTTKLTAPDGRSGTYALIRVQRDDDEVVYEIDADSFNGDGYPFPSVGEEIERLQHRWESIGGPSSEFNAWAQGANYDTHLTHLRKKLRALTSKGNDHLVP
jgi:hypothetical protein